MVRKGADHYKIYLEELKNKEIIAKMEEPLQKNKKTWSLKQSEDEIVNKLKSIIDESEKKAN